MKRSLSLVSACLLPLSRPLASPGVPWPISFKPETGRRRSTGFAPAADVNEAQPDGTRPIHWAVYKVDYELIERADREEGESGRRQ